MPLSQDEQQLVQAIKEGNLTQIEILITPHAHTHQPRVDIQHFRDEEHKFSILHLAARYNKPDVIKLMFKIFPNFNINLKAGKHNESALHTAAEHSSIDCIKLLTQGLKEWDINKKEFVVKIKPANINEIDNSGYTAFHVAVSSNRTEVALALLKNGANPNTTHNKGRTPLDSAIDKKNIEIIDAIFLKNSQFVEDTKLYPSKIKRDECYQHLIKLALEKDDAKLFRIIIINYLPNISELEGATGQIKKLLEYKPARREKYRNNLSNIKDTCTSQQRDNNKLQAMLNDQANTSDEESSDSEDDEFQLLRPIESKNSNFLYRAVHFNKKYFTTKERQLASKMDYHQKPIYSLATIKLAEQLPKKNEEFDYERADELIKGYFELLRLTPDRRSRDSSERLIKQRVGEPFLNLYLHFIQDYVMSYDTLFTSGNMVRNFNFYSNYNPIISTIPRVDSTLKFLNGEAIDVNSKYTPKVRKSTGKFKHRHLGYIHIYAIGPSYFEKHASKVGDFGLNFSRRELDEVIVESSIPSEYIIAYQAFSLPSFNQKWSSSIQKHFGLNEQKYNYYSNQLINGNVSVISELISSITKHQLQALTNQLTTKKYESSKLTAYKGIVFSKKAEPMEIINGTSSIGEKIQFERHKIEGGLQGECGIIAMPITDKKLLYSDILEVLKNNQHPLHAKILKLIGNDIMQLISLPKPDIKLESTTQEMLMKLVLKYQTESNEVNRLNLQQACRQAHICLSYLQDDLMQRNWVSINILRAWAVLNQLNLRIWQIQSGNQASVLIENIVNSNLPVHEILYVNGNHFDLLQRIEEQNIVELTNNLSKQATL